MADRKISDLTALTTPASGDYLPIVDISEVAAASKNKRITIEELMRGAPDGTAAAPSIAFESDPNTGIYSPGADQLAISTNGVERVEFSTSEVVFNDGGTNYDFRIEGDTVDSLFFIDASTDRVGIGTASPTTKLHVQESGICYLNVNGQSTNFYVVSSSTEVGLFTDAAVPITFANSSTEKARIDSSGRLLVGTSTTSAASTLVLQGYNGNSADFSILRACVGTATPADGGVLGRIAFGDSAHSDGAWVEGYRDGGTWSGASKPSRLVFSVTADGSASPTEALRISSNRAITVSDGGNVVLGTTTGTKIGTATTQKLGFFDKTPVVQPIAVADATDAASAITQLNALLARMRDLGLIAT